MGNSIAHSDVSPQGQPFILLTAALLTGILVDQWLAVPFWLAAAMLSLSIGAGITLLRRRRDTTAAIVILVGFMAAGASEPAAVRRGDRRDGLKHLMEDGLITPTDPVQLFGLLDRPPEPVPDGILLDVRANEVKAARKVVTASGSARLALPLRDDAARSEYDELHLDYGSEVRVLVRLEPAKSYSNPGSPDFNDFLERHGYQLRGTIKSPLLIQVLGRRSGNPLLGSLYRARLWFMARIDDHFPSRVAGTLKAMLAGNRYFVDPAIAERLRQSAAFHILVIAGFHIGIIAWVLLGRASARRRSQLRAWGALVALWAYAVAIGMEPPVVRATIMITVGIIGPILFRRSVSLNTVALSAFIMLVVNPLLVFDAGFQMSFVAVAGIVSLAVPFADKLRQLGGWKPSAGTPHPPARMRLRTLAEILFWDERSFQKDAFRSDIKYGLDKSRCAVFMSRWAVQPLVKYVSLLVITSLAIQLTTLPLMIFYFNRVAPIGVLINIVAGLLAGIIMICCILAVCAAPLSASVSAALAQLVGGAHHLLVNAVVPFLSVPGASFRCPHYEGSGRLFYGLYYIPLIVLVILLDRWRPVEIFLPITWLAKGSSRGQPLSAENSERGGAHPGPLPAISSRKWSGLTDRIPSVVGGQGAGLVACAAVLALLVVTINRPLSGVARGKLAVHFLDVGQGDSALVVFPRGSTMLVDAGGEIHIGRSPNHASGRRTLETDEDGLEKGFDEHAAGIGEVVVSRFLWSLGLRRLDYALATHAHEDHIGGFEDVLRNFGVSELIVGHSPRSSSEFRRLVRRAALEHVRIVSLSQGDKTTVDGVMIEVLWPPRADENSTSGNNDSIVLHLKYGSVSIMLTGDIEEPAETWLCGRGEDMHADLLKVPHHGSKTSSTDRFIDLVRPSYAVISVGIRSRFGHPSPAVVNRYRQRGIQLLETGRDGMVTAETDGHRLAVETYLTKGTKN